MAGPYRSSAPSVEPAPDPDRPALLQTWTSTRACPNCAVALFAARRHGVRIDACGTCGGCFLANDAAQRMLESGATASVAADLAAIADANATAVAAPISPRRCPDCNTEMQRSCVLQLDIDVCANHGTWFDRTELATLIARALPDLGEADGLPPDGMAGGAHWERNPLRMPLALLFPPTG